MDDSTENIIFPVVVHYKIIAEDRQGMQSAIEKVFFDANFSVSFKRGNCSADGRFVTFNADVPISSLELMRRLDCDLRNIEGVKFIL